MTLAEAIPSLIVGKRVRRAAWSTGVHIVLARGCTFLDNRLAVTGLFPSGSTLPFHTHLRIHTVRGGNETWLAEPPDVRAEDWVEVE